MPLTRRYKLPSAPLTCERPRNSSRSCSRGAGPRRGLVDGPHVLGGSRPGRLVDVATRRHYIERPGDSDTGALRRWKSADSSARSWRC